MLLLDAGNTLFGEMLALKSEGRVIVEAMSAMGYDAMTVGALDLSKGVSVLLERAKEARFPILSANMVSRSDKKPLLQPYTILERDGVRYGILGLTEHDAVTAPSAAEVIDVLDPVATARQYLPEIQEQSDMVIVLSHLGVEEDKALAQAVPGIQIIVGGRTRKLLRPAEVAGDTVIVQMGYDGEWMGRLDIAWDAQGQRSEPLVEIVDLGPDVADDPEMVALVKTWNDRFPQPTPPSKQ